MRTIGRLLFLLGGVGIAIGPFLPWVDSSFIDGPSLYDNAKYHEQTAYIIGILVVAGVTILIGLLRATDTVTPILSRIWGALVGVLFILAAVGFYNHLKDDGDISKVGDLKVGFFLFTAAAIILLLGVLLDRRNPQRQRV